MYNRKRPTDYRPPSLEELRKRYAELTAGYTRQHGKKAAAFESEEDEYKRLYKNVKSIESRNRRKELDTQREQSFVERYGFGNDDADANGITPKDRRRYLAKFKNCPHGSVVSLEYMKMMTGLNLNQIWILQNETGLKPVPAVTEKAAKKDKAYREYNAIYI